MVEEEIVIQTRPMVTRELTIDRHLVEEVRRFSENVRREDVRISSRTAEQLEADQARGLSDSSGQVTSAIGPTARAGTVEVRTGIVSERKSIVPSVTHEEIAIEQITVEPRPSERAIGSGEDSFDIPVYGEHVTLRMQPVVTEEITLRKEAIEDVQRVTTTVRREMAHVELEGNVRFHALEASEPEDA
jgi:uncharacterized protein (TIGR02271 family)